MSKGRTGFAEVVYAAVPEPVTAQRVRSVDR